MGDQDWFRWNSPQTAGIRVTVMAEDGSLLNAHLELADKSGNILVATEQNDDLKRSTRLFYQASRNTDYFVKIRATKFGPDQQKLGRYTVLLQVVPDDVPDYAPLKSSPATDHLPSGQVVAVWKHWPIRTHSS